MTRTCLLSRPPRDESGAIAVMVAVMSMVILGMAAVAIDMGQVYAKRASLQSAVDQAVLAAAAKIDGTSGPCTPEAQSTAKTFLISNWIDQGGDPKVVGDINLGGSATDGNGFMTCTGWRVDLWAPTAKVNLGLANAVTDQEDIHVPAHAAAEIKSPKLATLPMYISASCVSGSQVSITDPPNGHAAAIPPPDFPETGLVNSIGFAGQLSPNRFLDDEILAGATSITIKLQGDKYVAGDTIWFTNHDDLSVKHPHIVAAADVDKNQTTFALPTDVAGNPGIWWVRVQRAGVFMADSEARSITVGDIGLCNGSLSGNFGTLVLARTDPSHALVKNIILGAEPDLTINPSSAIPCPVAQSETTPTSPTDCISTKPGFPGSELTNGLIHGLTSEGLDGRLDVDTMTGCDRNGGSSRTPGTYSLNDDQLECFLVNGASIANVRLGGPDQIGLSGEIISSPRFFRIPILPEDPSHGTSTNYPIIDYYYVFITTEGVNPVSGYNGITMRSNGTKIQSLSLAMLNASSLPDTVPHPGKVTAYTGSGPKVIVLVD
jgi:hypothetical protein